MKAGEPTRYPDTSASKPTCKKERVFGQIESRDNLLTPRLLPENSAKPDGRARTAWYCQGLASVSTSPGTTIRLSPGGGRSDSDEAGLQDVYYASSNNGAQASARTSESDRSIDRSVGVWSNNVGSAAPVGIFSDDDVVSSAWHDTRAGDGATAASMSAFSCSYRSAHSARVDDLDDVLLTPPDQNIVVIVVFSSPGLFLAHGASGGRWITVSAPE